jgi:hypothetical protein
MYTRHKQTIAREKTAAVAQIVPTITSPPTHHDSDAAFVKARQTQLQQRKIQSITSAG